MNLSQETINLILKYSAVLIGIVIVSAMFKKDLSKILRKMSLVTRISKEDKTISAEFGDSSNEPDMTTTTAHKQSEDEQSKEEWLKLYAKKEFQLAYNELDRVTQLSSDRDEVIKNKAILCSIQSKFDFDKAIESIQLHIINHPENTYIYRQYSWIYSSVGSYNKALDVLDNAVDKVENKAEIIALKADVLNEIGDYQVGIDMIKETLSEDQYISEVYDALARLYKALGDIESSLTTYNQGFKQGILSLDHLYSYAIDLSNTNYYSESIAVFKRLLVSDYRASDVHCFMGNQYLQLGLYDFALNSYLKAEELSDVESAWVLGNIGNLYNNKGLYTKAVDYLQRAVILDNTYAYAAERLASALANKNQEVEREVLVIKEASKKLS